MVALPRQRESESTERELVVPTRVLIGIEQLDPSEQAAVWQALSELRQLPSTEPHDPRLRRLREGDSVYIFRAAPEVRLYVRLTPGGPVEVLEVVRPETLRTMFGTPDPVPESA